MGNNMFKKLGRGIGSTFVVSLLLFSQMNASEAAVVTKKVENDPKISIFNNNLRVSGNVFPILIDGTTYLPVRSLSGVLNKNVLWDGPTKSIYITDNVNPNEANLRSDISSLESIVKMKDVKIKELETAAKLKDTKIAELENAAKLHDSAMKSKDARIAELENQLKAKSTISLKDLERQLIRNFRYLDSVEVDITLRGTKDYVDVEIAVDLGVLTNSREWAKLTNAKIERYLTSVTNEIWYEYKDAEISGEVVNTNDYKSLAVFSGTKGYLNKVWIY